MRSRPAWATHSASDRPSLFAAYSVTSKSLADRYPGPETITYGLTAGAIPVVLALLPTLDTVDYGAVSLAAWAALLWSPVVPVYVAWTLWAWASVRVGVGRASTFMYLVPVIGGIGSWLLFGEGFGPLKLGGAALILAGLVLARRPASP
jgi:drug/metabolite transporter (DMT)-like permease